MNKNIFGQTILLVLFVVMFVVGFSEVSVVEVSKTSFFILLSISSLAISFGIIHKVIKEENKEIQTTPLQNEIVFFPNLEIFPPQEKKKPYAIKKTKPTPLPSDSKNVLKEEKTPSSENLTCESPETIAKVIRAWCQENE